MTTNTPLVPNSTNTQTSTLGPVQPSPFNQQAVKRYIFNETGNIMLSTTAADGTTIPDVVAAVFSEVAVFFAAMTKAISTATDPATGQPYSLYNYTALQNVIDGSGLFVHVTEEDITSTTSSFGANFSTELIEGLLGLATGAGALSFAQGMIASLGKAGLQIGGNSSASDQSVANIIFICEYLLGMPVVSAMVVSCNAAQNAQTFQIGPCFSESSVTTTLSLHKDTYMFVTPTFIKNYSGDLVSVTTDLQFLEFVQYLQNLVEGLPIITAVETMDGKPAPAELTVGTTYVITGAFLDRKQPVELCWVAADSAKGVEVTNAQVQSNLISFSPTAQSTAAAIGVFFNSGTSGAPTWTLLVATPMVYTAK